MPKINQTTVAELTLPLPPRTEQDEVVARCRNLLSEADVLQRELAMASRRVGSLRQSILTRAFEGRLVPQDPEDEAASVILERIRAERKAEKTRRQRQSRLTKLNRERQDGDS